MKKFDLNRGWRLTCLDEDREDMIVDLPHDAMCAERRSLQSRGRHNIGWFEGHDYAYTKKLTLPEGFDAFELELEGVYHNAEVYVNGQKALYRPNGYTCFHGDITSLLHPGENEIRVIARNADQPNSRWYTGTGIYRPVWLYGGKGQYILLNSLRIRTLSIGETARIALRADTRLPGDVTFDIRDPEGSLVGSFSGKSGAVLEADIPAARLWSPATPFLYTCTARTGDDEVTETFGIRTLTWTAETGIAVNGQHVILKGACIHHDNGVLGACAFPEAEERKIRLLKDVGYNAIRSAHNPCSKAMLSACDRLGVLVMDEYTDMWYIHKNAHDYASHMREWWHQDLLEMVDKDYNHPSVILYSAGNEVAETGQKEGIALTGAMTEYLHTLDDSRPVTCGINIFFNFLYSMGFGVYSDEKAKKESEQPTEKRKKAVGSEFYNTLAGLLGDTTMKVGASLPMCDWKTRDAYANMDVAGYNYGILRYRHDLKKYPNRLILGSETFCNDAYKFYELAKQEKRIVGDFVWAGMDYMGEAGIGTWEYPDHAPMETEDPGWLTAGSGRLNILGFPNGEAAYTSVALEREMGPRIAVRPVYQTGKHTPSAWKMTDAMESWGWPGCEGKTARIEVYARAASVELRLNGKKIGRKDLKNECVAHFSVPYAPGVLEAVSYDASGRELGREALRSPDKTTKLTVTPERDSAKPEGLCFLRLRYTDERGVWKPMEKHRLTAAVENGELLGFGNGCSYNPDGYWTDESNTYYGEALAVVRAGTSGSVRVRFRDETNTYSVEIPIQGEEAKC